jgi:spermidine/putrescine-binding protein
MKRYVLLLILTLATGLLAACSTANSGHASDAGREVHNEDGYTTLQQSIRF